MYEYNEEVDIATLIGKTFTRVSRLEGDPKVSRLEEDQDGILFTDESGESYAMRHEQDCCESVSIEDIDGPLSLLEGSPIILAECVTSDEEPPIGESYTWTFYKLGTAKGQLTIRWYGESSGYYSETAQIYRVG